MQVHSRSIEKTSKIFLFSCRVIIGDNWRHLSFFDLVKKAETPSFIREFEAFIQPRGDGWIAPRRPALP